MRRCILTIIILTFVSSQTLAQGTNTVSSAERIAQNHKAELNQSLNNDRLLLLDIKTQLDTLYVDLEQRFDQNSYRNFHLEVGSIAVFLGNISALVIIHRTIKKDPSRLVVAERVLTASTMLLLAENIIGVVDLLSQPHANSSQINEVLLPLIANVEALKARTQNPDEKKVLSDLSTSLNQINGTVNEELKKNITRAIFTFFGTAFLSATEMSQKAPRTINNPRTRALVAISTMISSISMIGAAYNREDSENILASIVRAQDAVNLALVEFN